MEIGQKVYLYDNKNLTGTIFREADYNGDYLIKMDVRFGWQPEERVFILCELPDGYYWKTKAITKINSKNNTIISTE